MNKGGIAKAKGQKRAARVQHPGRPSAEGPGKRLVENGDQLETEDCLHARQGTMRASSVGVRGLPLPGIRDVALPSVFPRGPAAPREGRRARLLCFRYYYIFVNVEVCASCCGPPFDRSRKAAKRHRAPANRPGAFVDGDAAPTRVSDPLPTAKADRRCVSPLSPRASAS